MTKGVASTFAAVYLVGCFAQSGTELTEPEGTPSSQRDFTDPDGLRWEYVGEIQSEAAKASHSPDGSYQVDHEAMTAEERALRRRPYMYAGRYKYLLSEDDALALLTEAPQTAEGKLSDAVPPEGMSIDELLDQAAALRFPQQVFGTDDRFAVGDTAIWPYNTIGSSRASHPNYSSKTCTVFKVLNNYTAIGAAHCIRSSGEFYGAPSIRFGDRTLSKPYPLVPGSTYNSSGTLITPPCYFYYIPAGFEDYGDWHLDYVIYALRKNTWTNCPLNTYNVGAMGSYMTDADPQYIMGYPNPAPPGMPYPTQVGHWGEAHYGANIQGGRLGTDDIDTSEGTSGGPWIFVSGAQPYTTGVLTRHWWVPFDYENQGPGFNLGIFNELVMFGGQ